MTAQVPGRVPLSDFPGPEQRARLLGRAKFFKGGALLFGLVCLYTLGRRVSDRATNGGLSARWLVLEALGVLFAALIIFVLYSMGRGTRRTATTRVALQGTLLIVENVDKRREIDLVQGVTSVQLSGGANSAVRPTMYVHRDKDDIWPVRVPLCDVETQTMRPAEDLLLLAKVLDRSNREENHAAAGRLRTLATWKTLPRIYRADRDAIPITPPDEV
jgi:hypothetical protein